MHCYANAKQRSIISSICTPSECPAGMDATAHTISMNMKCEVQYIEVMCGSDAPQHDVRIRGPSTCNAGCMCNIPSDNQQLQLV